jgi:large subunit ribosomal protein L22
MQVRAKSKFVRISPYKLRPIVTVIRGHSVEKALAWLRNCALKKVNPIVKTINSAYSNGKNLDSNISSESDLFIKDIRVDQGPIIKYHKPGAMGRANLQRKRFSHIEVVLQRFSGDKKVVREEKKQKLQNKGIN